MLSQTTVYALRAMAVLARLQPGESITGDDLADRTDIPRPYLIKVMQRLARARLVRSQRGQGGGFALQRPPRDVRVADVLAATDSRLESGVCVFGYGTCNASSPCALHPIWSEFSQRVNDWAEHMTLGDLTPPAALPPARRARQKPTS